MPCNSVNSFTRSVVRSALQSKAALNTTPGRTATPASRRTSETRLREFLYPHGLVEVAAQILLEGHCLQHFDAIAQRDLLIGVPEEAGIVEAGAQDAFVAVANEAVGIAVGVEHGEKVRQQLPVGVLDREILLVIAHHGDEHFGGQREEFGIEAAENHRRTLREIDDRVEQRLVFAPARAGNGSRGGIERFADALLAVGGTDRH